MNRLKIIGVAAATLAVVLLGAQPATAAPAQAAAAKDCVVSTPFGRCTSGSVAPYSDHTVFIEIQTLNGGCAYSVVDTANGAVVKSGNVYFQIRWSTLSNVYSRYVLKMQCTVAGWGTIYGT